MNCASSWEVLGAYVDREFVYCPSEVSQHIHECSSCRKICEQIVEQGVGIRNLANYYVASQPLRALVTNMMNRRPPVD
jgi:predicted anti-sigma-YlaC factor YlaD